jgi:4-amino-4-deoxy-L-arabinose transferase-like glycosyltransferase
MAATSLTKGLLGFALPAAVFVTHATWTAWANCSMTREFLRDVVRENRWLFNPWSLGAIPLAAGMYLAPFIATQSGVGDGLRMVLRENIQRFVAPHNHTGPIYLYIGVIFILAAPWSAFLPAAVWPNRPRSDGDRLARAFFWAVFLFFTASASRRSYYLLPVLPAAALLVGRVLTVRADEMPPLVRRLRSLGYGILGIGLLVSGAVLLPLDRLLPPPYDQLPPPPMKEVFATGWVLVTIAYAAAVVRRTGYFPAAAAVAAFAAGYTFLVALPAADAYRSRKSFATAVKDLTADDPDRLALYRARDLSFDLNSDRPIQQFDSPADVAAALRTGRVKWVVVRTRYLAGTDWPAGIILSEEHFPWEGIDQVGDKMVLLEAPRHEPVRANQRP